MALHPIDTAFFGSKKLPGICVVGNLLTDLIIRGVRQLPGWGREVSGDTHRFLPAGQAVNLAQGLSKLGFKVRIVGNVGSDTAGSSILADLVRCNVDTGGVEISPGATGLSVAIVRPDGERAFVSDFASLKLFDEQMLYRNLEIKGCGVICLVGLSNLPSLTHEAAYNLLARARAERAITVLDTGWDPRGWPQATIHAIRGMLSQTDIFIPNLAEAMVLTGLGNLDDCAAALLDLGPGLVVVKCGKDGSYGCRAGEIVSAQALAAHVYDTVGSGDVFNAGFLLGYLPANDLATGLVLGNTCAGLYISREVDRFPELSEVISRSDEINTLRWSST